MESNTDWNLVYQDPVYNEYQITNTYDPQLGALSVKKLLEMPTADEPAGIIRRSRSICTALCRDENGNYSLEGCEPMPDERRCGRSAEVKEAAEAVRNSDSFH